MSKKEILDRKLKLIKTSQTFLFSSFYFCSVLFILAMLIGTKSEMYSQIFRFYLYILLIGVILSFVFLIVLPILMWFRLRESENEQENS